MTLKEAEAEAWGIVRGTATTVERVLKLERTLRGGRKFSLARKILQRLVDERLINGHPERLKVVQKLALCTYKDMDLPADEKLQDALEILRERADLTATTDPESLGLAGAIYKRLWELTAQQRDLETSLAYYYRGYEQGVGDGYTGINAAFVLDLWPISRASRINHPPWRQRLTCGDRWRGKFATTSFEVCPSLRKTRSGGSSSPWGRPISVSMTGATPSIG